jgi:hypothetical protein
MSSPDRLTISQAASPWKEDLKTLITKNLSRGTDVLFKIFGIPSKWLFLYERSHGSGHQQKGGLMIVLSYPCDGFFVCQAAAPENKKSRGGSPAQTRNCLIAFDGFGILLSRFSSANEDALGLTCTACNRFS